MSTLCHHLGARPRRCYRDGEGNHRLVHSQSQGNERRGRACLSFLKFVGISEGKDREAGLREAREFFQKCGGTAAGRAQIRGGNAALLCATAKILDLPLNEFEKQFKAQSDKQAGNPVYKVFFPALSQVRRSKATADVRRACSRRPSLFNSMARTP